MRHFMQPRNTMSRLNEPSSSGISSPNPSYGKSKPPRKYKPSKENAPPSDPNSMAFYQKPYPAAKMKSLLPPRPPSSNPLKRKLRMDAVLEEAPIGVSDSGVKVIVRMRPPSKAEEGDMIVQRVSGDSLTINGQYITFDSVADAEATQQDIFQLVGSPLVENCLAGFNSSVFAYGQTGSGKTYTMWGPANILLEANAQNDQQGLTPRVFERLFARINEEQIKHAEKELKYHCRCSFLEIYNEQITDLLDSSQRNLQIREDVKSGVYVENLTEEYVSTMKDVTHLLIKGLSNRRTGATSINADSSRSHSVFTCVVEFRCKNVADGMSSFKTSRINLVDLAGSERQKLTGAGGDRLKEAGNINRSLSQLGNLINILAEVSQTGKQRHIPYRDSKLTFLLQESLGGNAKLAMVCAISPSQSCKNETFSTLRFAKRAKAIKNKAVINEVMKDDVNFLREVIHQLKDELQRVKANGNKPGDLNGAYATARNARRSLNILKSFGLNYPMTLPRVDDDGDEEMEIDEEAVEKLCVQVGLRSVDTEEQNTNDVGKLETPNQTLQLVAPNSSIKGCLSEPEGADIYMEEDKPEHVDDHDVTMADSGRPVATPQTLNGDSVKQSSGEIILSSSSSTTVTLSEVSAVHAEDALNNGQHGSMNSACPSSLGIVPLEVSPLLKPPSLSVSPILNSSSKSLIMSSTLMASEKELEDGTKLSSTPLYFPGAVKRNSSKVSLNSNNLHTSTERLAANLNHGIEIMESYRRSSPLRKSMFRLMYNHDDSVPTLSVSKVDVGVQTLSQDDETQKDDQAEYLCTSCRTKTHLDVKEANESSDEQLVFVDSSKAAENYKIQVPKEVEKVLAGSIRREMALEELCAKKTAEIKQLNRLVQQYKHERECNAILGHTREDRIIRLETLMEDVLPTEEFLDKEFVSLKHEHKLLKGKYDNHPEVLSTKIELKSIQDELESYRSFHDMEEREVLLEEIQDLRNQLQYYIDPSSLSARKPNSLIKLTYSCKHNPAPSLSSAIVESTEKNSVENLEQETIDWTKVEREWIALTDELRAELEASRILADKQKQDLETEIKCSEELKEAMHVTIQGHARMLEQYADLEEKHILLLARHRKIREGVEDVKKAAARAGVRGAESKFINYLATEISALKVEKEKERRYLRDENKGLQSQLRDTAEAVQAAGELLVKLKEAEEAVAAAQKRAMDAEQQTVKAYKQIDKLKRKHKDYEMAKYEEEPHDEAHRPLKQELKPFDKDCDLSNLPEPSSWFSGYDQCNI